MKKKALVALSGGLDSTFTAWTLKKQGFDVLAIFMRLGNASEDCERVARSLCRQLKIRFYPIDLSFKFDKEIISYFINSYARGETPNPCVKCNKLIKFGELFQLVDFFKADFLATGHYVHLKKRKNKKGQIDYSLFRGIDSTKDQSYFLYNLRQTQLSKLLFPLGKYQKEEVRTIVQNEGLPYIVKESQDICFLMENDQVIEHNHFLKSKLNLKPGQIKELILSDLNSDRDSLAVGIDGRVFWGKLKFLGRHSGLPMYTLGQRKGVEIGGTGPYYVAGTDSSSNTLYVVKDQASPVLFNKEFFVEEVNWVSGKTPEFPFFCETLVRYRHRPVPCRILDSSPKAETKKKKLLVQLENAERAITNGQSVVFYSGPKILGGGVIRLQK